MAHLADYYRRIGSNGRVGRGLARFNQHLYWQWSYHQRARHVYSCP